MLLKVLIFLSHWQNGLRCGPMEVLQIWDETIRQHLLKAGIPVSFVMKVIKESKSLPAYPICPLSGMPEGWQAGVAVQMVESTLLNRWTGIGAVRIVFLFYWLSRRLIFLHLKRRRKRNLLLAKPRVCD